ncbi:MAG: ParB/RepB/Spo0J family partition protein, partial [Leptolyngbya sp.]|nr:ParB/RepB/Spo0J family partition protein [Leptolyngbya sp.]
MSDKGKTPRGLGRGLSALMADIGLDSNDPLAGPVVARDRATELRNLAIEHIVPNPSQPRRKFDETALEELAQSLKERGIVQPIVVRPAAAPERFEIVAGERRWRAAQRAGLETLPALVRVLDDQQVLEIAIIENIQREGLNPIEEARGFRQLIDRFGHTQEMVATALGKSRSHIANLLRLLSLPDSVQDQVMSGILSAGHARALVTAENPRALAEKIITEGLSVRQAEALSRNATRRPDAGKGPGRPEKDADTRALEGDLSANLGMAVEIRHASDGSGELKIRYASLDE